VRCEAKTKAGKQCSRNAVDGGRCKQHAQSGGTEVDKLFEQYEIPPDCLPLVAAYAELHQRRIAASAMIDREGITDVGEKGEYAHPAVAIERQTSAELARIHREIVRSSKPAENKPEASQLDELAKKREARRARPTGAET
jgi:hypothetical protein